MKRWICTGVSGSGRIELLELLADEAKKKGYTTLVHDVGDLIRKECSCHRMEMSDERILDSDQSNLRLLRTSALKTVKIETQKKKKIDLHLIGIHATFRWKGRLIPGISYADLKILKPDGFINIVDDVKEVIETNKRNPKWDDENRPDAEETQNWMIEEEFITEVLAEVLNVPMFLVARRHNTKNLLDLLLSNKKRIYISYPITAVRDENPELLTRIQGPILNELENLFVVFNPLAIEDIHMISKKAHEKIPEHVQNLKPQAVKLIKQRTIERDYQFIDQSDAIVVFYLTNKSSPGVLAEIYYAHRNQKPVFIVHPGKKSPFLEDAATNIYNNIESIMNRLKKYATKSN